MNILISITILLLSHLTNIANAGSLNNGEWTPSSCGEEPAAPVVDDRDVDEFNKSVNAINDRQQQAKTYYGCLIEEANKDNGVIADKANREQLDYKKSFETISASVDAAKKKLDKK